MKDAIMPETPPQAVIVVDEQQVIDGLTYKRNMGGRPRRPVVTTSADVKRAFFTPAVLLELLTIELKMARNKKEDVQVVTQGGEVVTVHRRPYEDRVQQGAIADLLSRGGIIKITAQMVGGDTGQGLVINIIEEADDDEDEDATE
jgi:hypothetical protein